MSRHIALIGVVLVAAVLAGVLLWLDVSGADLGSAASPSGSVGVAPLRGMDLAPTVPGATGDEGPAIPAFLALPGAPRGTGDERAPSAPRATGRVHGVLLTVEGAPVAGEPVDLLVDDDPWDASEAEPGARRATLDRATSDAEGRFTLAARAGLPHTLLAGGTGFARVVRTEVFAGDHLTLRLEPAASVKGVVRDAYGAPVPEAWVAVLDAPHQNLVRAEASGTFVVAPLGSAPVRLAAYREGHGVGIVENVVPGWDDVEIVLPEAVDLALSVTSREGDVPVVGATITLQIDFLGRAGAEADPLAERHVLSEVVVVTDDEGRASLAAQPGVGFVLRVEAEGFLTLEFDRHRTRPVRDDGTVDLRLRPLGALAARVLDGESGAPVPGARVSLLDDAEQVVDETVAEVDGAVLFDLAAWPGEGRPTLYAEDDAGRSARVRPPREALDDPEAEIELALMAAVPLRVQVVDGALPVSDAQVAVLSAGRARTLGTTGADGFVLLEHRLAGGGSDALRLSARVDDRASLALELTLDEARAPDALFVLDLAGGHFATGRVVDAAGLPLADVRVSGHGHTDPDGLFRAGPFEDGATPRLRFTAEGYRAFDLRTEVPVSELVVTLDPVVRWEGRVRDGPTQRPLSGYRVQLEREFGDGETAEFRDVAARSSTDPIEPELFAVELPEAGRYRVRVLVRDALPVFSFVADFDGVRPPPFADLLAWPAAVAWLTVLDATGAPVPGLELAAVPWEIARDAKRPTGQMIERARSGRTDDDGRVRLPLGVGGSFRVAIGRGAWMDAARFDVAPGPAVERTYRLGPTGALHVRVLDELGRPVERARVVLRSRGRADTHAVRRVLGLTDAAGEIRGDRLLPGSYDVSVRHRSLAAPERLASVVGLRTVFVDVTMSPRPAGSAGGRNTSGGGGGGRGGR